ncbi:CoA-binding protein [Thermosipho melanesiensis]|uniref:CoA-binding domain protein n=2 Tax=Thermosipho melanesiensis TaxID=46541 RepID=A6LP54_THEM4|nr:CoA-binding protein [Thermosipho melanesiensis]ABR31705.1 CoA-binding domain protein [Thermosipho melanesiensis BI429]APT74728.1 succinyl-CoA synthetase subsunit alpha [Thermosipho melanesiensis]OOC35229.1 CoA-binding protein [Thermosipho melanesiensis]OOC35439.1 CoA-binding protein [Thermosipho melanesiensis]OOC36690.1 CoA-binding protein [Thermosipho melanesiensis]
MINGTERVCVQGITGRYGSFHTKKMLKYGTNIVCGVSKNKVVKELDGIPVLNDMYDAVEKYNCDTSIVFVPAKHAKNAIFEAINAGIKKIITITEHIPIHDMMEIYKLSKQNNVTFIGPNCPGVILPGISKIGIMPENAFKPGDIAIISKSGTLMYEISNLLSKKSTGIKIGIGLGGDPIIGTSIEEALEFSITLNPRKIIIISEIGSNDEVIGIEKFLNKGYNANIQVFFAGRTAPRGKKMGHAGAIVDGIKSSIEYKEKRLKAIKIPVAKYIPELLEG